MSDKSDIKGKNENSVKTGRLCHLIPTLWLGKEVVVMRKYILRIIFLTIVFLIMLTKKVR